tara:strand:+ start:360 stop:581 length:222 start_codon:yes stop_codon:yes gene_type:complete
MTILNKVQLEMRLKEMEITEEWPRFGKKHLLAKKMGISIVALNMKFKKPDSFKLSELEKLTRIGFFKSLIIEL